MAGHTPWKDIKHKREERTSEFRKRKRKDLINAMQITVYSLTDAELDKELRKTVEEAVSKAIRDHKDNQALAYTVEKE